MSESTVRFKTSGMHCGSCAMLIDMTLGDTEGVAASKSDPAAGSTVVTFDDSVVSTDQIIAAIQGAGYEAELEG